MGGANASASRPAAPGLLGWALYHLGRLFFYGAFKLIWRMRVTGLENVPREGGVIFAANHVSLADPPLVGCAAPRAIHFMAKQELFEIPVFGWLIRQVNAFPINRAERDVAAFRTAQRLLLAGGAMILFPEGRRQKDGRFGRAKPGVGMLAVKTGARVVPVYAHNSRFLRSFKQVRVCFGRPLSPEGETDYQEFSDRVMQAIIRLKETHVGSQDQA